jgi:hypothetical protein
LDGEIGLSQRNEWFAGVSVLNDEVTRVARQRPIFQLALRTRTDADHFVEKNEMVGNRMAALCAGFPGFGDGGA